MSAGMQYLNGWYAQWFNWRHGYEGHLVERRFWSELIETDEQLFETARYIVLNPVRAGICATAARLAVEQLPRDGRRRLAPARGSRRGYSAMFGRDLEEAREAFAAFVREGEASTRSAEPSFARSQSATSRTKSGSIWWYIGVSRYSTSAPARSSSSCARRPHSTPITGSSVPWPIATGGSGGDRSSANPSTVGMKLLNTVSAAGRGRPAPSPSEYAITPPCENPPSTSRS